RAVTGGLGRVAANVAAKEVHHLQVPDPSPVPLADALQLALEKLTALDGLHDGRRTVPVRRFQVSRRERPPKPLPGHQIVEPCEPALRELPELSGLRLTNRADAIGRIAPEHWRIARVA